MYFVGNERLQNMKREEDEQCAKKKFAGCEILQTWKFLHCSNLNLPSATPVK